MRAKIDTFNEELPQHVIKQRERSMGAKKRMNKLVTDSGVLTDTAAILNEATHFYSKLYSAEPVDESCIDYFLSDVKRMPDVFQSKCEASLTYGECMSAIGGMKSGKAPGRDGLPVEFYKLYFPLFGAAFVEMINHCFDAELLPPSMRHGIITLLRKDKFSDENINSWRPISLLNVDFKIVSKSLASRLKMVVHSVVHPDQTCAIPGRSVVDNLHLIRNVVDYAQVTNTPIAILALDQAKAFDRVSHEYLFAVLKAYGFGENCIQWIRLCYTQCTSQLFINGCLSESFYITRSIRQGCGLSALLYVLCIEPLAHRVRSENKIVGLSMPSAPEETKVSLYADDVTAIVCCEESISRLN